MLKCYYANMLTCRVTWLKADAGITGFINKRSAFSTGSSFFRFPVKFSSKWMLLRNRLRRLRG